MTTPDPTALFFEFLLAGYERHIAEAHNKLTTLKCDRDQVRRDYQRVCCHRDVRVSRSLCDDSWYDCPHCGLSERGNAGPLHEAYELEHGAKSQQVSNG